MSKENELDIKDKILKVMIELLNSNPIEDITIRKVATLADVNIAAVNYYFGSKDKLISAAVQEIFIPMHDIMLRLKDESLAPIVRLRMFLIALTKQIQDCSAPLRYYIATNKVMSDEQYKLMEIIKIKILPELTSILSEVTGIKNKKRLLIYAMQLNGSIIFPNLLLTNDNFYGFELPAIEEQVDFLLERLSLISI